MPEQGGALDWFSSDSEATQEDESNASWEGVEDDTDGSHGRTLAPENQRGGEGCCPWCLGQKEDFRQNGETTGCGHCGAAIPVGQKWYERGEKIVV